VRNPVAKSGHAGEAGGQVRVDDAAAGKHVETGRVRARDAPSFFRRDVEGNVRGFLQRDDQAEREGVQPIEVVAELVERCGAAALHPIDVLAQRAEFTEHESRIRHAVPRACSMSRRRKISP
jgi:hypothetical protein